MTCHQHYGSVFGIPSLTYAKKSVIVPQTHENAIAVSIHIEDTGSLARKGVSKPRIEPYAPRNAPHTPRNAPHTSHNAPHTPRNAPHTPRNGPHAPRNGPHVPRDTRPTVRDAQCALFAHLLHVEERAVQRKLVRSVLTGKEHDVAWVGGFGKEPAVGKTALELARRALCSVE